MQLLLGRATQIGHATHHQPVHSPGPDSPSSAVTLAATLCKRQATPLRMSCSCCLLARWLQRRERERERVSRGSELRIHIAGSPRTANPGQASGELWPPSSPAVQSTSLPWALACLACPGHGIGLGESSDCALSCPRLASPRLAVAPDTEICDRVLVSPYSPTASSHSLSLAISTPS